MTTTHIDKTIVVSEGETLTLRNGDSIVSDSDIDMILVMPNGRVEGHGAVIHNTNPECDKAKVKLDASLENYEFKGNRTHVEGLLLKGAVNEQEKGIGLHLLATGDRSAIQACTFRDMAYQNLNIAHYEEVIGLGVVNYINGNNHSGIIIDDCRHGLVHHIEGTGAIGIQRNSYFGLQIQTGRKMRSAVALQGAANVVQGTIFDFSIATGDYAVTSQIDKVDWNYGQNKFLISTLHPDLFNIHRTDRLIEGERIK